LEGREGAGYPPPRMKNPLRNNGSPSGTDFGDTLKWRHHSTEGGETVSETKLKDLRDKRLRFGRIDFLTEHITRGGILFGGYLIKGAAPWSQFRSPLPPPSDVRAVRRGIGHRGTRRSGPLHATTDPSSPDPLRRGPGDPAAGAGRGRGGAPLAAFMRRRAERSAGASSGCASMISIAEGRAGRAGGGGMRWTTSHAVRPVGPMARVRV